MNKNNYLKKSKILKTLIILVIIFSIVIGATIILKNVSKKGKENTPHANPQLDEYDTKTDGILNLSGFGVFFDHYTGDLRSSEIAKGLKNITINKIPRIYNSIKDYNEAELVKFYEKNSNSIKNMVGIDNKDDFVKFAQGLQKAQVNYNSWDRLDILEDTFVDESDKDGYAYAEYEVAYINGTIIKFSAYINKSSTADVVYIINIV